MSSQGPQPQVGADKPLHTKEETPFTETQQETSLHLKDYLG